MGICHAYAPDGRCWGLRSGSVRCGATSCRRRVRRCW
jgi:predicted DNA-binding helix-hairpin-helix protein